MPSTPISRHKRSPPAEAGGLWVQAKLELVGTLGVHGIGTILDPILADGVLGSVLVHVVSDHQGLVAVLNMQGVLEARGVDVAAHSFLGQADSHGILGSDHAGELQASGDQSSTVIDDLRHQAQVPSFISVDEVAGQHHLVSAAGADQAGQLIGRAHVAAADANVGIEAGEASSLGAHADIRSHSQGEAAANIAAMAADDGNVYLLYKDSVRQFDMNLKRSRTVALQSSGASMTASNNKAYILGQ